MDGKPEASDRMRLIKLCAVGELVGIFRNIHFRATIHIVLPDEFGGDDDDDDGDDERESEENLDLTKGTREG